ncbi:glycosyltransferase family 2 protein [Salipiger abyssi]|uniref:glycosyltransferase family 2 protein n=1 Tax=Salipiger abyssi TaxID=1250539 RepID=UPI001A8C02AA|nr:glycosyltransferase [Salipiger abyssi]MBN9885887.1 glycosyltransferase family 2 protein [Salipiger abyssi]
MAALPVSVVIVSRDRPDALDLCLRGVAQLDYPAFEVIVVACPRGVVAATAHPEEARLKIIAFDEANISAARNLGIAHAAGEIVAFIDDDAVPEPTWLSHLAAPFADPEVMAAGGYVRGRNGIDYQWRARSVTGRGEERELALEGMSSRVLTPEPGVALKLQGTNMAHRRSVLAGMGGFDPAFRFFLDETDLDLRRADAGHAAAIVPLAQVHHGYAQSARRAADRTPRDLTEIGASMAVFLAKHCPDSAQGAAWKAFRAGQRHRLLDYMRRGPLAPDDVLRLLRGLERGRRDGLSRPIRPLAPIGMPESPFRPFPGRPGAPRAVLSGRVWNRAAMRRDAARRAARGEIVSAFRFSHTALYHRLRFHADGYWEQIGGLWGKSERQDSAVHPWFFASRLRAEIRRIAEIRGIENRSGEPSS